VKRPRLGDIYEFDVGDRLGFFHYVGKDPRIADIIKVSLDLFDAKPQSFEKTFESRTTMYFVAIAEFLKPPPLIRLAGSMALTSSDSRVGRFVQRFKRKDGTVVYDVWEDGRTTKTDKLTPQQESYPSPYKIMSYAGLVDHLLKENGLSLVPRKTSAVPLTSFYFYAKTKELAEMADFLLRDLGLTADIHKAETEDEWALVLSGIVDGEKVDAYLNRMDQVAEEHGLLFDGFEAPVSS